MPEEKKEIELEKKPTSPEEVAPASAHKRTEDGGRKGGRGRRERNSSPREAKEFEEAILQIDRVTRVVKGGRRLRFRVSVVIGDARGGRVGFGIGKASEVMIGIQKAVAEAKKHLIQVPTVKGTLPHEVSESYKASRVLLFPARVGTGVIAGGAVRRILELAGVKDVLSKTHGSRNKLNVAVATMNALGRLRRREEEKQPEAIVPEVKKEASAVKPHEAKKPAPKKEGAPKSSSPKTKK